ncbi:MAG: AAA family ATPase [archaeon]|nr:AAA family ATPase [archaeon]
MIQTLEIENFKSIKHLKMDCKRINLFIGEPNTGKSNILETLGLLNFGEYGHISDFVRFEIMSNLFYDENIEEGLTIRADEIILEVNFKQGAFRGECRNVKGEVLFSFNFDYTGSGSYGGSPKIPFKFYKFTVRRDFRSKASDFLLPPSGENLLALLITHKELKSIVSQIFEPFGFKLVFKPQENKIEVLKYSEDILVSYPYSLASDTLQRIVFYFTAIESNRDSVIVFEEPESHAFPYYTKYLAERIALNKNNNQYFISTHNPYLLLSILEKAHKDEVAIFITYFEDYQTKVKLMNEKELEEIMELGIDIFFNIERFLEVKK